VDLQMEDGHVDLVTACHRFAYAGAWQPDADMLFLPGRLENRVTGSSVPATLVLRFTGPAATSDSAVASVVNEAGQVLISSQFLSRTGSIASRPAPTGCAP
jgi:hypothetical protein